MPSARKHIRVVCMYRNRSRHFATKKYLVRGRRYPTGGRLVRKLSVSTSTDQLVTDDRHHKFDKRDRSRQVNSRRQYKYLRELPQELTPFFAKLANVF